MLLKILTLHLNIIKLTHDRKLDLYFLTNDEDLKNEILEELIFSRDEEAKYFLTVIVDRDSSAKDYVFNRIIRIGRDKPKTAAALSHRLFNVSYLEWIPLAEKLTPEEIANNRAKELAGLGPEDYENSYLKNPF